MNKNYFNNLSIRYKLIIVLIIPVLTILYFSISGIYSKFEQHQEGKKSLEFIFISYQIDDLIHELQKERGISSGFVGSGGKLLRNELQAQRNKTNKKLKVYSSSLLSNGMKTHYWGIPDAFSRSKLNTQSLNIIRNKVNSLNNTEFFDAYSDIISTGLDIIRNLQVIVHGVSISRQSEAYTNLLELQERSGQERGLLNGVFLSGKLDAERFISLAGHISDQKSLFRKFYTVASKKQKVLLKEKLQAQDVVDFEKMRTAAIHKASRNDRLNSIQSLIGYGGLIHNFKNYVIRGNQENAVKFNTIYIAAIKSINEYKKLPGISEKEISSLNTIKATFEEYNDLIASVNNLRKKGRSIQKIDSIVRVDDSPALEAIEYLHSTVTGLDTSLWWKKATVRIKLMKDVSDTIRADIQSLTKDYLSATTDSMIKYLALTIVSLSISFTLGYGLIHYLIGNIVNIATHMSNMQKYGDFDNLLPVNGDDEISQVAKSFNNLIIEREKHEEQLRLAAMVFNKASEAMVVTDAENNFVMINPAFTKITGYKLDEIMGLTPAILQSGKQDKQFYQELWNSLKANGYWAGEIINKRKNGEIYPEWLNINVIKNNKGEIIQHIAMFSDISERKLHEEQQENLQRQLLQAQKMESIGQLTGGIAHDFNNMLSAILGYTELAMELEKDNEVIKSYLKEVDLAGHRAKDLIAQMLAFSRGSKSTESEVVDIKPIIEQSIKMIRPLLPSTIELETHFTQDESLILINPVVMHQLVMNICINARDAIINHGKIEFELKKILLKNDICHSCHKPILGNYIELSIKDSGMGIETNILDKLFDPFFSTKEMGSEKGTGMGLAMVHGILHDYAGHIIVESEIGKGSVFRLLFPVADLNDDNKNVINENISLSSSSLTKELNNLKVLVVDDEEAIVSLIKEALSNYGINNVIGFSDSSLALKDFKEHSQEYDVVITDQTMPKLTGSELAKEILSIKPDLPIILCTGFSERVDEIDSQNIGIKAFMQKPVRIKSLIDKINQLVS